MTGLEGLCLTIHSNRAKYTSIAESWELLYDFGFFTPLLFDKIFLVIIWDSLDIKIPRHWKYKWTFKLVRKDLDKKIHLLLHFDEIANCLLTKISSLMVREF